MLSKRNCLKKKKDFENLFRKGKKFKEDFLLLRVASNNLKTSRFGFVVGKKVFKKAVLRNQLKRRLREIVRFKIPQIKKGIDVILIAMPGFETKDFWEIEEIVNKIFNRANIIEKPKKNV
ncbi:MAG: ribonuclease P protein component [Candidatus Pacebacteria bacterium]|nr:ribonuclease P protein component [Candidatus Paceibacterota bacterium]